MSSGYAEFRRLTSIVRLKDTLAQDITHGSGVGLDGIHPGTIRIPLTDYWVKEIRFVSQHLRKGDYKLTPYREMLVLRGRSKFPRPLCIPTVRDRIAIKTLTRTLTYTHGLAGPPIAQRLTGRVAGAVRQWDGCVRLDIENYFGSISHDLLEVALGRELHSPRVRELIMRAVRNPVVPFEMRDDLVEASIGIPQGISLSSALAEIYLQELDARWKSSPNFAYFRYVDDILLLCPVSDAHTLHARLVDELAALRLKTHPLATGSKSWVGPTAEGFDYLGYRFLPTSVSVGDIAVRRIEHRLARAFSEYSTGGNARAGTALSRLQWRVNVLAAGTVFRGEHRGWVRFYSRATSLSSFHHLDHLVQSLAKRHRVPITTKFKKFVRTYYSIHSLAGSLSYIPNPDLWTENQMRQHLVSVEGWDQARVATIGALSLRASVVRALSRDLADLERDLDPRS